jgi:Dockerin type I domain
MIRYITAFVFVAVSVGRPIWAAADNNILVNGSFEGATSIDSTTGDILPTGWQLGPPSPATLSKVNVDSAINAATFLGPEAGTHYARFQSPANNGTRDCLLQDLTTIAGQKYAVSFWAAETSTSVGNNSGLDPEWDENTGNQKTLVGPYLFPSNTGPQNYQFFSFTETASSTLTRLDFHGVDQNGSILLDNVVVSPLAPGDFNRDGHVNDADIQAMMTALADLSDYESSQQLSDSQLTLIGDLNGDTHVNDADLQSLISRVANSTLPGGGGFADNSALAAVSEPAASSLMALAGIGILVLHRCRVDRQLRDALTSLAVGK